MGATSSRGRRNNHHCSGCRGVPDLDVNSGAVAPAISTAFAASDSESLVDIAIAAGQYGYATVKTAAIEALDLLRRKHRETTVAITDTGFVDLHRVRD